MRKPNTCMYFTKRVTEYRLGQLSQNVAALKEVVNRGNDCRCMENLFQV